MPGPVITLLTDFGLRDSYVGSIKGVVMGINPGASLVDITHDVQPQDVLQGAFLLGTAWRYFPPRTIHLAVVDPGVGTERKALLLQGHGHSFLAPDNGLLSFVLPAEETGLVPFSPYRSQVPLGFQAYVLINPRYWRHPVSSTFHGRDLFAPVAAYLSLGVEPGEMGEPVETAVRLALHKPRWEQGSLAGIVIHVDRFGNLVTSIPDELISQAIGSIEVELVGKKVGGLVASYAAAGGLAALIGGHGYLEIALPNGSAARSLGAVVGDKVVVRRL